MVLIFLFHYNRQNVIFSSLGQHRYEFKLAIILTLGGFFLNPSSKSLWDHPEVTTILVALGLNKFIMENVHSGVPSSRRYMVEVFGAHVDITIRIEMTL